MAETTVMNGALSRPGARFVAIGLFLMAFFTVLWATWSFYGLPVVLGAAVVVIFGAFAVVFVVNSVQLIRSASRLPSPAGDESQRRGRALQLGFGITFASEGVVIQTIDAPLVASLVGVATACGTAAYGVYMLRVKRAILATLAESDPGAAPAR